MSGDAEHPPNFLSRYTRSQRWIVPFFALIVLFVPMLSFAAAAIAVDTESDAACMDDSSKTLTPAPRDDRWTTTAARRWASVARLRYGLQDPTLMLLGDSIAWRWTKSARAEIDGIHIVNFGISGDRVENLLWRMDHFDYTAINSNNVLIVIGTNNLRERCGPDVIADGVMRVVRQVRAKMPGARIFVMSLLPRGAFGAAFLSQIRAINATLQAAVGDDAEFLDLFTEFYGACAGQRKCALYDDFVHPNESGYEEIKRSLMARINGKS
jgi:lysophospholipase L1-like esterase